MALDPVTSLTTIDKMAAQLGLTLPLTVPQTATVEMIIAAASSSIEDFVCHPLGFAADIVEPVKGYGSTRIRVSRTPVFDLQSVVYGAKTDAALDPSTYFLEHTNGKAGETGLIEVCCPRYTGKVNRYLTTDAVVDTEKQNCIWVKYDGGYCTPEQARLSLCPVGVQPLPPSIELACLMMGAVVWGQMGFGAGAGVGVVESESLMSHSIKYKDTADNQATAWQTAKKSTLPAPVAALLSRYKRIPQY